MSLDMVALLALISSWRYVPLPQWSPPVSLQNHTILRPSPANTPNRSQFVQSLASPYYLNFLASQKYFDKPAFVAYLKYLLYFTQPPYLKFISYPGPTLKHLELLQEESFRMAILSPDVTNALALEGKMAGLEWADVKWFIYTPRDEAHRGRLDGIYQAL